VSGDAWPATAQEHADAAVGSLRLFVDSIVDPFNTDEQTEYQRAVAHALIAIAYVLGDLAEHVTAVLRRP
jgi:hypothetical protein